MAQSKKNIQDDVEQIRVRLKPILGIKPGVYLTIFYSLLVALLLFLVLLYPGIRRNGSMVTFSTKPEQVRILVDGRYAGATPCTVFVPRGNHAITLERRFFESREEKLTVQGRIFGSLLFPRRLNLHRDIGLSDADSFLGASFHEAASWGMIESFHDNYQRPPLFEPAVKTCEDAGVSSELVSAFLESSMALVRNEESLRDYIAASARHLAGGGVFSVHNLLDMLKYFIHQQEKHPAFLFWLPEALPSDLQTAMTGTTWFESAFSAYSREHTESVENTPTVWGTVKVAGGLFVGLRGGSFILGKESSSEYPVAVQVQDLYILDREVTRKMYTAFLEENPSWKQSNIEDLIASSLVTEEYLQDIETPGGKELPVRYISYHAASAYCGWLEKQLPSALKGWTVRLPFEAEWEWAARMDGESRGVFLTTGAQGPSRAGLRLPNSLEIYDLSGNLWEWCENWYYPTGYTVRSGYSPANRGYGFETGVEKAVRGGSWANRRDEVHIHTRGSQPAEWCTPFIGFRPVIVRE